MSTNFWKSLPIRTGSSIALTALLMNFALTYFFYNKEFDDEIIKANVQISQLFSTVKNSASVAAYLDNQELATEVTQGLTNNDLVAGAQLTSITEMNILSGDIDIEHESHFIVFKLTSPFIPDENAGHITIHPNQILIEKNARKAAQTQAITIAGHSAIIVILVIFLVNFQLTNPLKSLIEELHNIDPGSDNRLVCPKRNKDDEIGQLVLDTNLLLAATQNTIEGERRLREYMEKLERRFRLIFEKASSGIALIDEKGKLVLHNPSFEQLITEELFDNIDAIAFEDLFTERSRVYDALKQATQQSQPINLDLQLATTESNHWLHVLLSSVVDEQGNLLTECLMYDISERAAREQRTKIEAERDPLTYLLNRRAGEKKIEEVLTKSKQANTKSAILLIDLDQFKPINDTYGHDAGDNVLITVAKRLTSTLRKTDAVIRWGGDEFLVVIQQGHEPLDPSAVCQKLIAALSDSIDIGDRDVTIGASIGGAVFPDNGDSKDVLIDLADKAMYQVKQQGRDGYRLYSPISEA